MTTAKGCIRAPRLTCRDFWIPTLAMEASRQAPQPPGVLDTGPCLACFLQNAATKNRSLAGAAQRGQHSPLARGILRQRQSQNQRIWDAQNLQS